MNKPLNELILNSLSVGVYHYLPKSDDPWDFDAPYQRGSVWNTDMRRNLVKSLLMGLPVGYTVSSKLSYEEEKPYRVIDGKQRIETVRNFTGDYFNVPGWWWNEEDLQDPDWRTTDVNFSQLSTRGKRRFEMCKMPLLEFDGQVELIRTKKGWDRKRRSPEELLQAEAEVYLLINFGGVAQTDEDAARATKVAGR